MVKLRFLKFSIVFGGLILLFLIFTPIKIKPAFESNLNNQLTSEFTSVSSVNIEVNKAQADDVRLRDRIDPNSSNYNSNHYIINVWRTMRGLINSALVIVLLLAAFANILHINIDTYTIKKVLPAMVLGVILANFSLFICRMFLDVADVVSTTFLQADITDAAGSAVEFGNKIEVMLGFDKISFDDLKSGGAILTIIGGTVAATGWATIGIGLLFGILIFILGPVLIIFLLAMLFWARGAFLQFLIMISPLAFFLLAFPFTQQLFKKWWSTWLNWVFMKPVVFALLWMGSEIGKQTQSTGANLLSWVMGVTLLVMSVMVPFKLGGIVGSALSGFGDKVGKWGLGLAGRKIATTAKSDWTKTAEKQEKFAQLRDDFKEYQDLKAKESDLQAKYDDDTATDEEVDQLAKLEELEKDPPRPPGLGARWGAFGPGAGGLATTDWLRRTKQTEQGVQEAWEKAQMTRSSIEGNKALIRDDAAGKLERLKDLEKKKVKLAKTGNSLSTKEGVELNDLRAQRQELLSASPKALDKIQKRIIKKRIEVNGYEEAKYATAESAMDFFEKNKTAVANFKAGRGYKNTAHQNWQLEIFTEEMRTDLNKVGSSGDYQNGVAKAHAYGIKHTGDLTTMGITKEDLKPENRQRFLDKAMRMTRYNKQIFGAQVANSAKASHRMSDRPFKGALEFGKEEIDISGPGVTVRTDPSGKVRVEGSTEAVSEMARKAEAGVETEGQKLQEEITGTMEGTSIDVDIDTELFGKITVSAKNPRIDDEQAVENFMKTVKTELERTGRTISGEQETDLRRLATKRVQRARVYKKHHEAGRESVHEQQTQRFEAEIAKELEITAREHPDTRQQATKRVLDDGDDEWGEILVEGDDEEDIDFSLD
ncbi:MAG: hypothetical protein ABH837_02605 [bacterium]